MTTNNASSVDLVKLFGSVAQTLSQNKSALNEADTYNHDHGDNMVQIFEVITQAMKDKKSASAADQLDYAADLLRSKTGSGSAQLYAEGLKDAASQFTGQKSISINDGMKLIQTLLGSSQSAGGGADILGSLLGGLAGGTTQTNTDSAQATGSGADILGSLLGGLAGGTEQANTGATQNNSGIDLGDILNAGAAFMQAKQSGSSNLEAIVNALVSGSKVGNQDYRAQSGALVANTLMQVISQMAAAKK